MKENESKEGTCIGESNLGDASGETKEDTSSELETKRGGNEFWDEHCVDCTKEFKVKFFNKNVFYSPINSVFFRIQLIVLLS